MGVEKLTRKYAVIKISPKTPRKIRNKLSKVLLGTTVTIKGRRYRGRGLVPKYGGIVLCPGTYLIPIDTLKSFLDKLKLKGLGEYIVVKEGCICSCT
jgi:hypothetical protein